MIDFKVDADKWWRRSGPAFMAAAVPLAVWSTWAALAVAGIGIGMGGWYWLERWRRSSRAAVLSSLAEGLPKLDKLLPRERGESLPPIADPAEHTEGRSAESPIQRPLAAHASAVQSTPSEIPEAVCHPQNSFRLATEQMATDPRHGSPPSGRAQEVIDRESVLGNIRKRYRIERSADRAPAGGMQAADAVPAMIRMEEIRRRLAKAYGGRLPSAAPGASADLPKKSPRGAEAHAGHPAASAKASEPYRFPQTARMPAGQGAGPGLSSHPPANGRKAAIETSAPDRRDSAPEPFVGGRASHAISPLDRSLPQNGDRVLTTSGLEGCPVDTELRGEPELGEMEDVFAPANPCIPDLVPPSPPSLAAPSAAGLPALPVELPARSFALEALQPLAPLRPEYAGEFSFPPLSLLHSAHSAAAPMSQDDLIEGGILIEEKLAEFRVKVNVQDAYAGPVITRYEVQPAVGVRGGQVVSLMRDLARALGVASIRVVETIPGKTCMGLEVPNACRQMIRLSEVLSSEVFQSDASKLAMVLGKDITGEPVVVDLARAPHMLVAGTTGSGKSVGVNAMILSMLYRATPAEVRFVMIDPKMLELSIYDGIPHLLTPVVTDMKLAANALSWCVEEMERRYRLMSGLKVRNLAGYNQKVYEAAIDAGGQPVDPSLFGADDPVPLAPLPYIVVVVDELADLMMIAGKKIEELIARLAQKARAAGIHLILATQRPSVDVITGLIKANIPTRIAFQVSSKIDSRTILDQMGAECLLGQGDMLYLPPGSGYPVRVHGAFVADEEVQAVAEYLKQFGEPDYVEGVLDGAGGVQDGRTEADNSSEEADPLYDDAVSFVIDSRRASISAVQRHLRIGYNRAARLVEQMEVSGLVSPMESNGNRKVLVPPRQE